MLCDRCGTAIATDSSTCASCGADNSTGAKYVAAEAPKARKNGCLVFLIVFIAIAILFVVSGGFEDLMGNLLRSVLGFFVCLLTIGIVCS